MSRSAPFRRATVMIAGLTLGAVLLAGCATRATIAATDSPSPTPVESVTPTAEPTPAVTGDATPVPVPAPTASEAANGATVLFITLDLVSGVLEASGMVADVVEEGGECTLTLQRGAESRSVSGPTATGPESTFCSLLTVPVSELERGDWQATLSYRSDAHAGVSDSATVSVP